jgi:hypothetical protein
MNPQTRILPHGLRTNEPARLVARPLPARSAAKGDSLRSVVALGRRASVLACLSG